MHTDCGLKCKELASLELFLNNIYLKSCPVYNTRHFMYAFNSYFFQAI